MLIRRMTLEDIPAVVEIEKACFYGREKQDEIYSCQGV